MINKDDLNITVTENNIHIEDSYVVKTKENMKIILKEIQEEHPECNTFKRSYDDLTSEWMAHNRLYH